MLVKFETNFADGFEGDIVLRLIFSGCKRAAEGSPCKGCHNPDLWNFELKDPSIYEKLEIELKDRKDSGAEYTIISIIGGEPLDQSPEEAIKVLRIVREYYDLPIITYTGKDKEEVIDSEHPFVTEADYIKCGPYIEELVPTEEEYQKQKLPKLASRNQALYKVKTWEQLI